MRLDTLLHPPERRASTLVILLPGAYMTPAHFQNAGFASAVEARGGRVDLAIPAIDLAAITDGTALPALREQLLVPARATGYRHIWLGGISLGAFMALAYATEHAEDIDGLCLFAPYPGSRITSNRIVTAGGLAHWQATEEELADPEFRVWHWLKSRPSNLPIYCGYGREDRFAKGMDMMAAALPAEDVHTVSGTHDWPAWLALWQHFLEGHWLPAASPP